MRERDTPSFLKDLLIVFNNCIRLEYKWEVILCSESHRKGYKMRPLMLAYKASQPKSIKLHK